MADLVPEEAMAAAQKAFDRLWTPHVTLSAMREAVRAAAPFIAAAALEEAAKAVYKDEAEQAEGVDPERPPHPERVGGYVAANDNAVHILRDMASAYRGTTKEETVDGT